MKLYNTFSASAKVLLLFPLFFPSSSADPHSLQFLFSVVTGINSPEFTAVGLVDGQQYVYYDSNTRKAILKTEWIKKFDTNVKKTWNTKFNLDYQMWFQGKAEDARETFNHTDGGCHTLQRILGCEMDDDGTTRAYYQDAYDGEDLISLDLKSETFISTKPQAEIIKNKLETIGHNPNYCKGYLQLECVETLKNFLHYSRKSLEMKVAPTASVFQEHSSSPDVVCHATGFFPKALNISWQKDGEDVYEDVEIRETLPNQDGSFQKRSVLKVSAVDLQKHTYTCLIQHSSLEKEMVLEVPKGGGSDGGLIGIIVGVVVFVIVVAVAGILVWKKKKSGFKPVPHKPSPGGDSSSNDS